MHDRKKAFTVVELLITISIIGLLAAVVYMNLSDTREKSGIAKTKVELDNLKTAVTLLAGDTGKWPNGCPQSAVNTMGAVNEVDLSDLDKSGLYRPPIPQITEPLVGCEWTADDVANWNGPYVPLDTLSDYWNQHYWFDHDYYPQIDCPTLGTIPITSATPIAVVVSGGPNKSNGGIGYYDPNWRGYDCDDLYAEVEPF